MMILGTNCRPMAVVNFVVIVFATSYAMFSGAWALAGLIFIQGGLIWIIESKSNLIEDLLKLVREQEATMNRQNEVIRKYINAD